MKFLEALLQFALSATFAFLAVGYLGQIPSILSFLSASLASLALWAVVGGGWPLTLPLGRWKPGKSRAVCGLSMTLIWLATSLAVSFILGLGLDDVGVTSVGLLAFWIMLAWGVNLEMWPLRRMKPSMTIIRGGAISFLLALVVNLLVLESGLVSFQWVSSMALWHIAWFLIFSPSYVFQDYPFTRFKTQPRVGAGELVFSLALAILCMTITSNRLGILPHDFPVELFPSSMIMWTVAYSWIFGYIGIRRLRQWKRGALALLIVFAISTVWSLLLYYNLLPGREYGAFLNLYLLTPMLVIHNLFWLRAPLNPPFLPGMPPPYQTEYSMFQFMYDDQKPRKN